MTVKSCVASAALLLTVMGCKEEPPTLDEDLATLEAMRLDIFAQAASSPCTGSDDCASLPMGDKPCGGAWGYVVYSKSAVDEAELMGLVDEYTAFNRTVNERWDLRSDCSVVAPPVVRCIGGECVDSLGAHTEAGWRGP